MSNTSHSVVLRVRTHALLSALSAAMLGSNAIVGAHANDNSRGSTYLFGMDNFSADPASGTFDFNVAANTPITLSDPIDLTNVGGPAAVIDTTGFLIIFVAPTNSMRQNT